MAAPEGDSPGGSHMVLGEPPKMSKYMYMCVKSKSPRAVAPKVPLTKLGARMAARCFCYKMTLFSYFCDAFIEKLLLLSNFSWV